MDTAQVPDPPTLVDRLVTAYGSADYRRHFDFVDHLRPEKRPGRVRDLEELLLDALSSRQIDDAHMAAPEVVDTLDLAGFRSRPKTTTRPPPLTHGSVPILTRSRATGFIPSCLRPTG